VAGATGVAGAAGVDVLRAGGRRGLLNGKCFLTVSFAVAAVLATLSMLVGKKKINRHFTLLISHPLSLCRFFLTCGYLEFWPFFSAFFT
jgi:hypothetical protein